MTEDEAKNKWCPFARVCAIGPKGGHMTAFNRIIDTDDDVNNFRTNGPMRCIGSQCMAWRETTKKETWPIDEALAAGYRSNVVDVPDFYCGLAGKP